jgi:hypothetical protein
LTFNLPLPGSAAPASGGSYSSLTVVTPGIYLATFSIDQSYTGTITICEVNIVGANVALNSAVGSSYLTNTLINFSGAQVITCTASTYNLRFNYTGATMGIFTGFFYLTRIG